MNKTIVAAAFGIAALAAVQPAIAAPVPVDLSTWTAEGPGTWVVQPGNDAVLQTLNGNPTVFYSPTNAQNTAINGKIQVTTGSDDDFIGFVLGYNPGDLGNAAANYILIDWKQGTQGSFSCSADAGLAISQVSGTLANNSGAWCHDPLNNVTELQRAANLGATGWADNIEYDFEIIFTATNITVSVDGVEELNINGVFTDGRVGFYNYSQQSVLYSAIEEQAVLPEPASVGLVGLGLVGLGFAARRRSAR